MENWNTKESLLLRAQNQNDESAWEEFVAFYKNFIRVVLVKSSINFGEIDDLVQVVLVKVWKGLPKFEYRKNNSKFRTWLSYIIRNSINDYIDKINRRGGQKLALDDSINNQLAPNEIEAKIVEEWEKHITQLAIENVKKHFSGNAIDVFLLSMKGTSVEKISKDLNLTPESIYVLRRRVKAALQKEVSIIREKIEFH